MTEEDAKTKWCPFARSLIATVDAEARLPTRHSASGNRWTGKHLPEEAMPRCIGSACMAWRVPVNVIDERGYVVENARRDGYCGLAGAPQ